MAIRRLEIDLIAHFTVRGHVEPKGFFLYNGKSFAVRKVLDAQKAANRKVGGAGMRYKCLVLEPDGMERTRILWREGDVWFVEETVDDEVC